MLILSRKENESFWIEGKEGKIEVIVTEISGGQVRLGIHAPKAYKILHRRWNITVRHRQPRRRPACATLPILPTNPTQRIKNKIKFRYPAGALPRLRAVGLPVRERLLPQHRPQVPGPAQLGEGWGRNGFWFH